jgi:hypothetical protein
VIRKWGRILQFTMRANNVFSCDGLVLHRTSMIHGSAPAFPRTTTLTGSDRAWERADTVNLVLSEMGLDKAIKLSPSFIIRTQQRGPVPSIVRKAPPCQGVRFYILGCGVYRAIRCEKDRTAHRWAFYRWICVHNVIL